MSETYSIQCFEGEGIAEASSIFDRVVAHMVPECEPGSEALFQCLRDDDDVRGKLYRLLPNLLPVINLCSNTSVRRELERLSGQPSSTFCCVNINVRMDFGKLSLQTKHNLNIHQDFHYSNPYVTPKNSFVLWAPLKLLDKRVGGINFMKTLLDFEGAVPHKALYREGHPAPHWTADVNPEDVSLEEIVLTPGEYILFDMRHLHSSASNEHPVLPRLSIQARYSSFLEKGFLSYQHELRDQETAA